MNSNNPLVSCKHNFVLDRKILFIDSNDRDKERWPNPAEFEINCPQNYNNVKSLRLVNIMLPNFFYNISEQLQTNKMIVDISGSSTLHIIKLEDGCYNYTQLQDALLTKFKNINTNFEITLIFLTTQLIANLLLYIIKQMELYLILDLIYLMTMTVLKITIKQMYMLNIAIGV